MRLEAFDNLSILLLWAKSILLMIIYVILNKYYWLYTPYLTGTTLNHIIQMWHRAVPFCITYILPLNWQRVGNGTIPGMDFDNGNRKGILKVVILQAKVCIWVEKGFIRSLK